MRRPPGLKAYREIRGLPDAQDRIPPYVTLLEFILRALSPGISAAGLNELIEAHEDIFPSPGPIYFANKVRNDLIHALGMTSETEWIKADRILAEAIRMLAEAFDANNQAAILGCGPDNLAALPWNATSGTYGSQEM